MALYTYKYGGEWDFKELAKGDCTGGKSKLHTASQQAGDSGKG